MDSILLAARVLLSLAAVLGLLWYIQRKVTGRFNNGSAERRVTVVTRQGIAQKAFVVVIDTEGKRFVLGVTEHSVSVLHSADTPEAAPAAEPVPAEAFAVELAKATSEAPAPAVAPAAAVAPEQASPLQGSILSPATWKQGMSVFRGLVR